MNGKMEKWKNGKMEKIAANCNWITKKKRKRKEEDVQRKRHSQTTLTSEYLKEKR